MNSAEPGGIIQVDKKLSDAEFDEMCLRWKEQHQGVQNAHRVAVLEQATWVDRKYTQRDMQFAALREMNREIIREAFGFPKPLLGTTTDVNRANAEAAEVVFARWCVRPRLEKIKMALNEKLLPQFGTSGKGLFFDYEDPTPQDRAQDTAEMTAKTAALALLTGAGFDAAEVCQMLDLPELARTAPAPAPTPFAQNRFRGEADPVQQAQRRIESGWGERLDTEQQSLERFIDAHS